MFWIWQSGQPKYKSETARQSPPIKITVDAEAKLSPNTPHSFEVANVSYLEHVDVSPDSNAESKSTPAGERPSNPGQIPALPPIFSNPTDERSAELIRLASNSIRNSPAFLTQLQIKMKWFQREYKISGTYLQAERNGQTKTTLHCETPQGPMTLIKFCDGRFLYTLVKKPDEQQTLEFVDLKRVEQTRNHSGFSNASHPMSWISNGGLGSGLENLASAFDFEPAQLKEQNRSRISTIQGRWKISQLFEMLQASAEAADDEEINWERLPNHIPHAVEIELAEHPVLGHFPQKITFIQFRTTASQQFTRVALASIQFTEPVPVSINPSEFLDINAELADTADTTQQYINQIRDFEFFRQSRQQSELQRR